MESRRLRRKTIRVIDRAGRMIGKDRLGLKTAVGVFRGIWSALSPAARIEVQKALQSTLKGLSFELAELTVSEGEVAFAREQVSAFNLTYALCLATRIRKLRVWARAERQWAMNRLNEQFENNQEFLMRILGTSTELRKKPKRSRRLH